MNLFYDHFEPFLDCFGIFLKIIWNHIWTYSGLFRTFLDLFLDICYTQLFRPFLDCFCVFVPILNRFWTFSRPFLVLLGTFSGYFLDIFGGNNFDTFQIKNLLIRTCRWFQVESTLLKRRRSSRTFSHNQCLDFPPLYLGPRGTSGPNGSQELPRGKQRLQKCFLGSLGSLKQIRGFYRSVVQEK